MQLAPTIMIAQKCKSVVMFNDVGEFVRNHLSQVCRCVFLKASLHAKSLLFISVFIHIEIITNHHNKKIACRLALKERLRATGKWPI